MVSLRDWVREGPLVGLAFLLVLPVCVGAAVSPEEAAQLGYADDDTPLTPMGAIRAGNEEGTIPPWTGGITEPPSGYVPGGWYVDPYSADEPLFTVTAQNYKQYEEFLTPGFIALLEQYPDRRKMHVYPSRRSASYPKRVYDLTMQAASQVELCPGQEHCLKNIPDGGGIPFPIPKSGLEAQWNHQQFYYGDYISSPMNAVLMSPSGDRVDVISDNWFYQVYWVESSKDPDGEWFTRRGGPTYCLARRMIKPARSAGQIFGGCSYVEDVNFEAYLYIPGQRRVRRAPEIGLYDHPSFGSDGQQMADQANMFLLSGSEARYDQVLHPREEKFIAYNNYGMATNQVTWDDLFHPNLINADLVRYELHRVWKIELKLREGYRHMSPNRYTYLDEDSWAGAMADIYDTRGNLWRTSESFLLNFYNVPMVWGWGEIHYDLPSGGYTTSVGFYNEFESPPDFFSKPDKDLYTPQGLRKYGLR